MIRKRPGYALLLLLLLTAVFVSGHAKAETSVLLTFTGDCTLGSEESKKGLDTSLVSTVKTKGYDYFFANFREMFEQDDQTVINFEGVLSDYKGQEFKSKTYRFRGTTDFVKILTGSSIEACSLANNHINDFGKQGEESTKATLEENGIHWFQRYKPYIYEKDGIRIAFVSLHNIWNEFDKVKALLQSLKEEQKVNATVVCWHAGREYRGAHENNVDRTSKTMIKYGADLIIMCHPHVLQGIDIYEDRCVFYSLGNFVFGGNDKIRTEKFKLDKTVSSLYSMVVQVRMLFSDNGEYLGQHPVIYPVYTSSAAPANNYQPYRVNAEDAVPIRDALQEDSNFRIPDITVGPDGLSKIDLGYIAAFDGVEFPNADQNGPRGIPEAADPAPSRETKSN
ncbi:MAG: CapA family protein [Clostridiales bacterium]|nr:CapA family protein [Clostridiales bacterium]